MTGKYYTIQISYSTQDPVKKISISLKPESDFLAICRPSSLNCRHEEAAKDKSILPFMQQLQLQNKKRETKDGVAICESSPRKNRNNEFEKLAYNNSKPW